MSWVSEALHRALNDRKPSDQVAPGQPVSVNINEAVKHSVSLAVKIVVAMEKHGYTVFREPGQVNIVYLEGANIDGSQNDDVPNRFNDIRCTIMFAAGTPVITGIWEATTEPGKYWTEHAMNPKGAARIKFDQYSAWQVGIHNASKPSGHEALVQTGGKVTVCRDLNEDYIRTGDEEDTGFFGINQHHGYNMPSDNLGSSSAGCLVGRSIDGHKQFMEIVKKDPRYVADHKFVFTATVMDSKDVA